MNNQMGKLLLKKLRIDWTQIENIVKDGLLKDRNSCDSNNGIQTGKYHFNTNRATLT